MGTYRTGMLPMHVNRPLLTVAEAAIELRLSVRTVRRLCRSGALPNARFGRQFRIPADAVRLELSGKSGGVERSAQAEAHRSGAATRGR